MSKRLIFGLILINMSLVRSQLVELYCRYVGRSSRTVSESSRPMGRSERDVKEFVRQAKNAGDRRSPSKQRYGGQEYTSDHDPRSRKKEPRNNKDL